MNRRAGIDYINSSAGKQYITTDSGWRQTNQYSRIENRRIYRADFIRYYRIQTARCPPASKVDRDSRVSIELIV